MANPAKMLAQVIVAESLIDGEGAGTGWRLFRDTEPDSPDTTVTLYNVTGRSPNPKFLIDYPSIQVRVRGAAFDSDAPFDKLDAIKSALLGLDPQNVTGGRLTSVTMSVDILSLGLDSQNRQRFVATFTLIIEPTQVAGDNRIPLP